MTFVHHGFRRSEELYERAWRVIPGGIYGHQNASHVVSRLAVAEQRRKGNCFNGPTPLWVELAERLVALTPWSAWAAFAKNGSDVCIWAIQVATLGCGTGRR